MVADLKRCTRCQVDLPLEAFARGKGYKDGIRSWCRACTAAYRRKRRHGHEGYERARSPRAVEGAKTCTGCGESKPVQEFHRSASSKDGWHSRCKVCSLVVKAEYYKQNRDKLLIYQAGRRNADLEAARAYERQVYQRRKPKHRATMLARDRRMEKPDADTVDYITVLRRDPCAYCGGPAGQVDHIEPVVGGGRNHWSNLTAACQPCNRAKWSKPLLLALLERKAVT